MIVKFATLAPNVASASGTMMPAGPAGTPGIPGEKGDKGDRGDPGPSLTLTVNGITGPNITLTPAEIGAVAEASVGVASGVASLDGAAHVPLAQLPPAIVGALQYQGTWNASANSPTLASSAGTKGFYYKVSVAGSTTLDGISTWDVGDEVIFDGTVWDRVFGGTGPVLISEGGTGQTTAAAARGPNGLAIEALTAVGNANYTILSTDRVVGLNAALTAARTWTLPAAASLNPGQTLKIRDLVGGIGATNTLTLVRAGSDTIDGGTSTALITAYAGIDLDSDGISKWTYPAQTSVSTFTGDSGSGGAAGSVPAPAAGSGAAGYALLADGVFGLVPSVGGSINKIRNGTFDVWQRGTSSITVTTSGAYTADGWFVAPTGASVAVAAAAGRLLTVNSLQITGASGVTDVQVKHPIESYIAAAIAGQQVTIQAQILNNTGATITPTLTIKHPSAADNYTSSTTDVSAVSLQACANGAWTRVAYSFTASASAALGLEAIFDFGNNFSTSGKSIAIAEVDIRVTPGFATGLIASPPPPELRFVSVETELCHRYYQFYSALYGQTYQGSVVHAFAIPTMRVSPIAALTNFSSSSGTASISDIGANYVGVAMSVSANEGATSYSVALTAEIAP